MVGGFEPRVTLYPFIHSGHKQNVAPELPDFVPVTPGSIVGYKFAGRFGA
jgi:hypothetical protein